MLDGSLGHSLERHQSLVKQGLVFPFVFRENSSFSHRGSFGCEESWPGWDGHSEIACRLCHVDTQLSARCHSAPCIEALPTLNESSFLISGSLDLPFGSLFYFFVLLGARQQRGLKPMTMAEGSELWEEGPCAEEGAQNFLQKYCFATGGAALELFI